MFSCTVRLNQLSGKRMCCYTFVTYTCILLFYLIKKYHDLWHYSKKILLYSIPNINLLKWINWQYYILFSTLLRTQILKFICIYIIKIKYYHLWIRKLLDNCRFVWRIYSVSLIWTRTFSLITIHLYQDFKVAELQSDRLLK